MQMGNKKVHYIMAFDVSKSMTEWFYKTWLNIRKVANFKKLSEKVIRNFEERSLSVAGLTITVLNFADDVAIVEKDKTSS